MPIAMTLLYLSYAVAGSCLYLFSRQSSIRTAAFLYVAGLIFLPVGLYPHPSPVPQFPYWIIGIAWPSNMLVTKAWIVPLVTLGGAILFGRQAYRPIRFTLWDGAMLGWCLWPLAQSLLRTEANPPGWLASLYLIGSWGAPWLIGRMLFGTAEGRKELLRALAILTLCLLPIAIIEGLIGPSFYGWLWHRPPFEDIGAPRYIGFRPVAFFEDGNQYGIWLACASLAALGLVGRDERQPGAFPAKPVTAILCAMTIAAQSVGAIALLIVGAALLKFRALRKGMRRAMLPIAAVAMVGAGLYASGILSVEKVGQWGPAHRVVGLFKDAGRQSLPWRVMQDQKALPLIGATPIAGSGKWDWWFSLRSRPWGFPLLLVGQYGLIGLMLMLAALAGPAVKTFFTTGDSNRHDRRSLALALVAMMALCDALLNSFIFLPWIAISASLISDDPPRKGYRKRATQTQSSA